MHDENETWGEWHMLFCLTDRDLGSLVRGEYRDTFKARAVAIMMTPKAAWMPFVWKGGEAIKQLRYEDIHTVLFADRTKPLTTFTLALLQHVIDIVLPTTDHDSEMLHAYLAYNALILEALGMLAEDDPRAQALCERYQLTHTVSESILWEHNSRTPLHDLLCAKIPEVWKQYTDTRMRDIICDKRNSPTVRAQASALYAKCVLTCHSGGHRPYSSDLLASQMAFILEHADLKSLHGHHGSYARHLLQWLSDDEYKDLRRRFVYALVIGNDKNAGVFCVKNPSAHQAAQDMLREFGPEDGQLRERLRTLIATYKADRKAAHVAEVAREKENITQNARLEAVLAKMR
jgi:hypothetical protein